ncbi:MAG: HAD family hydrolase [Akkermansiaceae bacterium]|nr:HAD family hydrolase [Akkermansiaceae bacterium]
MVTGYLYDRLLIPTDWIENQILKDFLTLSLEQNFLAYRRTMPSYYISKVLTNLTTGSYLDFGNLPDALQQAVIEKISDPIHRSLPLVQIGDENHQLTEWLSTHIKNRAPSATPDQLAPYSLSQYQKKIVELYSRLSIQPEEKLTYLSSEKILTAHLHAELFHFQLSAQASNLPPVRNYRAAIFDIYGTLLIAPAGGVKPDTAVDPKLRAVIEKFGYTPPESPSASLHIAVTRHHTLAGFPYPEVDLRLLWNGVLQLGIGHDLSSLVEEIEAIWHPAQLMPGATDFIGSLSRAGISLGILSNAQSNTLSSLGGISELFSPELSILSYQYGIAKPSPELFQILKNRLAERGIQPAETLYIGNDPLHDIIPAANVGFQTALFVGHPESIRMGDCTPNFIIENWNSCQL